VSLLVFHYCATSTKVKTLRNWLTDSESGKKGLSRRKKKRKRTRKKKKTETLFEVDTFITAMSSKT
jgi:hypothetical protein